MLNSSIWALNLGFHEIRWEKLDVLYCARIKPCPILQQLVRLVFEMALHHQKMPSL